MLLRTLSHETLSGYYKGDNMHIVPYLRHKLTLVFDAIFLRFFFFFGTLSRSKREKTLK